MKGVRAVVPPSDLELDAESQREIDCSNDPSLSRKLQVLAKYATGTAGESERSVTLRFLVSPVELLDTDGRVSDVRLVRNELYRAPDGSVRSRPTQHFETMSAGMVLRSAGYRGVPVHGLPFDTQRCLIPNDKGRVIDPASGQPIRGLYVSGWIKRQPTGVIGTNKPDAAETVESMIEDAGTARTESSRDVGPEEVEALVEDRQPGYVTFDDWQRLDRLEVEQGAGQGRPRVKFVSRSEMLAQLGRSSS